MQISLCMIVRDNEAIIQESLQSICPWVDEMIVVDTGSRDRTPEIARSLGAKVSYFPWIDDFSAARNASLDAATGEWLFWMDSDDVISPECGQQLRALADGPHSPETLGYVMQVHCPGIPVTDVTVVDHVKLIRKRPDLRFEGRIHEQILSAIRRAGGEVAWTDIYVTHKHAALTPQDRLRKFTRDLRILKTDLEERPEHPFVLFNLGMTLADMGEYEQACDYLDRSVRASGPQESHLRKAYALRIACSLQLGDTQQAEHTCQLARQMFPEDPELLFRAGIVAHQRKDYPAAIARYRELLEGAQCADSPRYFSSRDAGIQGYKARHNLATVYFEAEQFPLAELQWRLALEEIPTFEPALLGLGETLIRQRKLESASALSECWMHSEKTESEPALTLLRAKIALAHELTVCKPESSLTD